MLNSTTTTNNETQNKSSLPHKITIVINKNKYVINEPFLLSTLLPFLRDTTHIYDSNIFVLPISITKDSFELFLWILTSIKSTQVSNSKTFPKKPEPIKIRRSIDIALYLSAFSILKDILSFFVINSITKSNCIDLILLYKDLLIDFSNNEIVCNPINDLINKCKLNVGKFLIYIIENKKEELLNLSERLIDEIIGIYFKYFDKGNEDDNKKVFAFVMELRRINNGNILNLVEGERMRIVNAFQYSVGEYGYGDNDKFMKIKNYFPVEVVELRLNINDITKGFIQEHNIKIEDVCFRLMCNYSYKNDELTIRMQLNKNKQNTNSDNNNDLSLSQTLSSSSLLSSSNNSIIFTANEKTKCSYSLTNNNNNFFSHINNSNNNMTHNMISILSYCNIFDIKYTSKTNFNCLYTNLQQITTLFTIQKFYQQLLLSPKKTHDDSINNEPLSSTHLHSNPFQSSFSIDTTINIYFARSFFFSALLSHVSKHFDYYIEQISLKSLQILPKTVFRLILNYPLFNPPSSEKLLEVILTWLKNKEQLININTCIDMFNCIKWKEVSLEKIVDFIMLESAYVKKIKGLSELIYKEISERIYCNEVFFDTSKNCILFLFLNRIIDNSIMFTKKIENQNNNCLNGNNLHCYNKGKYKNAYKSIHENYLLNACYLNKLNNTGVTISSNNNNNMINSSNNCYYKYFNNKKIQMNIRKKGNMNINNNYLNNYHPHKVKSQSIDKTTRNFNLLKEEYSSLSLETNNFKKCPFGKEKQIKHHKSKSVSNNNNIINLKNTNLSLSSLSVSNILKKQNEKKQTNINGKNNTINNGGTNTSFSSLVCGPTHKKKNSHLNSKLHLNKKKKFFSHSYREHKHKNISQTSARNNSKNNHNIIIHKNNV